VNAELFAKTRERCADIAENARWVRIDQSRLTQYPETLVLSPTKLTHSAEHHLLARGDDTLVFFLLLDTINFGSGYFPMLGPGDGGGSWSYYTTAKRLKEFCEKHGLPSADKLRDFRAKTCAEIFRLELANPHAAELMQLFALALNDLGRWTVDNHNGDYLEFLRKSKSVETAVQSLMEMPFFLDIARYGLTEVHFLKRAQIMLHDMRIAEPNHELLAFEDFNRLTVFADNVIPFVLKVDRVLQYDPWLDQRIQNGELICSGSFEEIEIRACSLYAVEMLRDIVCEEYREITAAELDYCLWNRGQLLKATTTEKPHRTRCMYY
jgi:hypothetical protein